MQPRKSEPAFESDTGELRPGMRVAGRYELGEPLGRGGMGVVFRARHVALDAACAIKVVRSGAGLSAHARQRFEREARAAAQLKSEHIVDVTDYGFLPSGMPFMVMERLVGEDLAACLARRGKLPIAEAVDIVMQVAAAMAVAHRAGIVHRDIKPANVFLTRGAGGQALVKVLDFGVAKRLGGDSVDSVASERLIGTPRYMPPEQLRDDAAIDHRADVYAMAALLHHLLTGAPPFPEAEPHELLYAILHRKVDSLTCLGVEAPEALSALVQRALDKDPQARPESAEVFGRALLPFTDPGSITSRYFQHAAMPSQTPVGDRASACAVVADSGTRATPDDDRRGDGHGDGRAGESIDPYLRALTTFVSAPGDPVAQRRPEAEVMGAVADASQGPPATPVPHGRFVLLTIVALGLLGLLAAAGLRLRPGRDGRVERERVPTAPAAGSPPPTSLASGSEPALALRERGRPNTPETTTSALEVVGPAVAVTPAPAPEVGGTDASQAAVPRPVPRPSRVRMPGQARGQHPAGARRPLADALPPLLER